MKIYTSRYSNGPAIVESGAAPIRITVGHPRFKLEYKLADTITELAPDREWFGDPDFPHFYRARLYDHGVAKIRSWFDPYDVAFDGVVLLCFEDVFAGKTCHRTMFADWWTEETGEPVAELPDAKRDPRNVLPPSDAVVKKADRFLADGLVRQVDDDTIQVGGDHGLYLVKVDPADHVPLHCTCKTGENSPWVLCSHRVAAFKFVTGEISTLF